MLSRKRAWNLCLAARLGQGDASGAQRAFRWRVGWGGSPKATEKGYSEFLLLFSSVNQDTDPYDDASQVVDGFHYFGNGTASGQHIVNNQDTVARIKGETTPENPVFTLLLSEYTLHPQLPGGFEGEDNATGGWSGNYLDFVVLEMPGDELAELLGMMWVLQNAKLLPIYRRVEARSKQEVPLEHGTGVFEDLRYLVGHAASVVGPGVPSVATSLSASRE